MITAEQHAALAALTEADVVSVYNGKPNRCACGCSGRHTYMSVEEGTKSRGYAVDDDEVSVVRVRNVLRTVQKAPASEVDLIADGSTSPAGNIWSWQTETRLYVVYAR